MKINYLTIEDIKCIDPLRKAYDKLAGLPEKANHAPHSSWIKLRDGWEEEWLQRCQMYATKHPLYVAYNNEMRSKVGPQGGRMTKHDIHNIVMKYYDIPTIPSRNQILSVGRDILLRLIAEGIEKHGRPLEVNPKFYRTQAGLPLCGKKGDVFNEQRFAGTYGPLLPAIPWYRRMRNKDRAIFMDATTNVREIEDTLNSVRYWLRAHIPYFAAWNNPFNGMKQRITKRVLDNAYFIETDYIGMDMHFTKDIALEYVYPIYELLCPDTKISFGTRIEQWFYQPVYFGNYMLEGEHSLLSGGGPTNDFETIYSVELYLGTAVVYGVLEDMDLLALGDDVLASFKHCTKRFPYYFAEAVIGTSSEIGMVIHPLDTGKSNIRQGECIFLREVYERSGRKVHTESGPCILGGYPSILALNSIINPEAQNSKGIVEFVANLDRIENVKGAPDFSPLIDYFIKINKFDYLKVSTQALSEALPQVESWWERVYGTKRELLEMEVFANLCKRR